MGISIGSKKPGAKEIDINFKRKHLVFGLIVFVCVVVYYTFVSSPYIYHYVICDNGTKEILDKDNIHICGLLLPHNMGIKEQVEYYNNYVQNQKPWDYGLIKTGNLTYAFYNYTTGEITYENSNKTIYSKVE